MERGGGGGAQAPLSLPSPPFPFPPLLPPPLPSRWMDRWMLVGDAAWRNGSGGPTRPILPSSHLRRRSKRCAAIPLERRMRSPSRQTPRSMNCCLQIRGRVGAGMSTDSFSFFFRPPFFVFLLLCSFPPRDTDMETVIVIRILFFLFFEKENGNIIDPFYGWSMLYSIHRHFSYSDELKIAREISIASWSLYNVRYIYI